jgi:pimeloyl-ACP methyl ester carboxylesterase
LSFLVNECSVVCTWITPAIRFRTPAHSTLTFNSSVSVHCRFITIGGLDIHYQLIRGTNANSCSNIQYNRPLPIGSALEGLALILVHGFGESLFFHLFLVVVCAFLCTSYFYSSVFSHRWIRLLLAPMHATCKSQTQQTSSYIMSNGYLSMCALYLLQLSSCEGVASVVAFDRPGFGLTSRLLPVSYIH